MAHLPRQDAANAVPYSCPPGLPARRARLAGLDQRTPLVVMTMLALWLASHPWRGIWHDGKLYAAQALRRLYPANFENDLFFLHGSQDAFTLFSPLYAAVINALGLETATMLLLLAAYLLWIAAATFLLGALLRGWYFYLGLAMLFAWPSDYGPTPAIFRLSESFLTPRLYAEALGMLTLGCLLRGRWLWAAAPAVLGLLLHPLMGCGPILAGVLLRTWGNWRVQAVLLILGAGVLAIGIAAGLPLFGRLQLAMDAQWLALVADRAPMVTWTAWHAHEWVSRTLVAFSVLFAAGYLATGLARRLFWCAAIVGGAGLLATWVGTGLNHNLLLIQAQPWRVLWMTQLCAWLALAWLLADGWQQGRLVRVFLLALCLAVLTRSSIGGAIAVLSGTALCWLRGRVSPPWPDWGTRASIGLVLLVGAAWLLEVHTAAAENAPLLSRQTGATMAILWLWTGLEHGAGAACGTALLLLSWHWGGSQHKGRHLAAFALALTAVILAVAYAGFRGPREFDLGAEASHEIQRTFQPLIPPGAVVYWQNQVKNTWEVLQRSNYASVAQIAGLAFNRGTAVEGARRIQRLSKLGGEDAVTGHNNLVNRMRAKLLPPPSRAGLQFVCQDPILDFVIVGVPLGGDAIAQVRDTAYDVTYYLYACTRLRAAGAKARPGQGPAPARD